MPGAAVVAPDQLLTRPPIDTLAEAPTTNVTGTFTTCGCALVAPIETTAVYAPGDSPAGDAVTVMEPGPLPAIGEIVIHLAAGFAGERVAIHCDEPPLKLTGMTAGATDPDESATFKVIVVPGAGDAKAAGVAGAASRIAVVVPTTKAPNPPLSVIPVNSAISAAGVVTAAKAYIAL